MSERKYTEGHAPKFTREDFDNTKLEERLRQVAKQRAEEETYERGISLTSVTCDDLFYETKKNKFEGYVNFIPTGNEDDSEEEHSDDLSQNSWNKKVREFSAPQKFLNETAKMMEKDAPDVFAEYRTKTIAERENSYQARWRKRAVLSPERVDPFSKKKGDEYLKNKRTYAEILQEVQIEKEKRELLYEIKKNEAERKRRRELEKRYGRKYEELISDDDENERKRRKSNEGDRHSSSSRRSSRDSEDKKKIEWGKPDEDESKKPKTKVLKEEPNFKPSGKLYEKENTFMGVKLKWSEPPEARLPKKRWRLYVYKNDELLNEPYKIHRQPYYMFGRELKVVDIPTEHPSCSKQHAVLCFRQVEVVSGGKSKLKVKPYIIDLKSTNGTFLNGKRIEDSRYYELKEFDVLKFGNSSREYVLLHENSSEKSLLK